MLESPTIFDGDLYAPEFVREAANWVLTADVSTDGKGKMDVPFGSGLAAMHEVQPGLRCELHELTCHSDLEFNFLSDPFISCSILLEGTMTSAWVEGFDTMERKLNRALLLGFGEPTRWKRLVRAGQYFRSFGFTMQPEFFERFAGQLEDEQLSVLDAFRSGRRTAELPRSQRLVELGWCAFDHPYSGSLASLYHESNTLQFLLEVVQLLREETQLVKDIGRKHYDRLMEARAILDGSLNDPPKSLDLARQVGTNLKTLQAHFKLAFGTTIFGYIKTKRLEVARVLITEHALGSAETGYRVGYSNPAAFTAAYRKHFGHPPSAERN